MNFDLEYGRDFGSTSSTLLEQVRCDDAIAWSRLVKLYAPLVYYWCQQSGLSKEDCFEVGQEAFLAIHKSLRRFSQEHSSQTFRGWIRTITKNKVADRYRRLAKRVPGETLQRDDMDLLVESVEPNLDSADEEKRLLYLRAMQIIEGEFQEKHQQAFVLMIIEGWRAQDVALRLDMTPNAVFLARHHILKRLKTEFAELLD